MSRRLAIGINETYNPAQLVYIDWAQNVPKTEVKDPVPQITKSNVFVYPVGHKLAGQEIWSIGAELRNIYNS